MPLCIIEGRHGAQPTIVCDYCQAPIARGAEGNYQWQSGADGAAVPMAFTHKQCNHPFEQTHPGPWMAIELEWLLVFLKNTLKVEMKTTEALIRKLNF
jgi:hypothetical protein